MYAKMYALEKGLADNSPLAKNFNVIVSVLFDVWLACDVHAHASAHKKT